MGNKTDMNEVDILELLSDDLETKVIMMYLEDIHEGRRFMEIAKKITKKNKKPIVVIKSGTSAAGAKAAASHTGNMRCYSWRCHISRNRLFKSNKYGK